MPVGRVSEPPSLQTSQTRRSLAASFRFSMCFRVTRRSNCTGGWVFVNARGFGFYGVGRSPMEPGDGCPAARLITRTTSRLLRLARRGGGVPGRNVWLVRRVLWTVGVHECAAPEPGLAGVADFRGDHLPFSPQRHYCCALSRSASPLRTDGRHPSRVDRCGARSARLVGGDRAVATLCRGSAQRRGLGGDQRDGDAWFHRRGRQRSRWRSTVRASAARSLRLFGRC